jgi:hypothetical protein
MFSLFVFVLISQTKLDFDFPLVLKHVVQIKVFVVVVPSYNI